MTRLLENNTHPDPRPVLALIFTTLLAMQIGMVNTTMAHPEVPTVVND